MCMSIGSIFLDKWIILGSVICLLAWEWVTLLIKTRLKDANVAICCVRVSSSPHATNLYTQFVFIGLRSERSSFCEENIIKLSR